MKRVKGLSNENYRERFEAQSRTLKALYDGDAAEPIPPEWMELLDKPILTLRERPR